MGAARRPQAAVGLDVVNELAERAMRSRRRIGLVIGCAGLLGEALARAAKHMEVGLGWMIAHPPGAASPVLWHNGGTSGVRSFVGAARKPAPPWSCSATPPDRSTGSACGSSRRCPAKPADGRGAQRGNRVSSASGPGSL
jgi:hypothetical protein